MQRLADELPHVIQSISYTTRTPREGEHPGKDYHFVGLVEFKRMIEAGEFLEYVNLYGHYYGTSSKWIEERLAEGKSVILVIDTQGGLYLKQQGFEATYIFVRPPSMDELKRRLKGRSTETSSVIEERLACVDRELEQGKQYDYEIVNDDLDEAYEELKTIILEEDRRNQ
jgi:guanylate kinase